ncbi:hypothetical protein CNBG_3718 [Cryptococcus deuterogattii R265]|uniref:uncharacterized protein n=1 Tax=Cryptococcus deuterogattii (strain R265) TaxID=294750 RepID=UPI00193760B8|nr:hypothetical protein CNBG_3718 [Cryptococcus deuterogattii R265]
MDRRTSDISARPIPPHQPAINRYEAVNTTCSPPQPPEEIAPAVSSDVPPFSIDDFIGAITSQLPHIEGPLPVQPAFNCDNPPTSSNDSIGADKPDGSRKVRLTWWRPCGPTAIVPGLKKITLKIQVTSPIPLTPSRLSHALDRGHDSDILNPHMELIDADGRPKKAIMLHLLDLFFAHFGSQFPYLDKAGMTRTLNNGDGSVFMLNCIAAISARFSVHPAIALPHLQPYSYGAIFTSRAKALLGSLLSVPSRDTILSCLLLAMIAAGDDSESEVWTMTGLAVRMSLDMGLHQDQSHEIGISDRQRRLDRLLFGSVILFDHSLCFGVGRTPSINLDDITQPPPTLEDVRPPEETSLGIPTSAFPWVVRQMLLLGREIFHWNIAKKNEISQKAAREARAEIIKAYSALPADLVWSFANLQKQDAAHQGLIFVNLHLWMHTILATEYLTDRESSGVSSTQPTLATFSMTSSSTQNIWRHSVRIIGEILVLSDVINSFVYIAQPLINVAFFVASSCHIKEMELSLDEAMKWRHLSTDSSAQSYDSSDPMLGPPPTIGADPSTSALFRSIAVSNVSQLLQGLDRMTTYWSGIAWIAGTVKQRLDGIHDIDLAKITEQLETYVVVGDPGVIGQKHGDDQNEESQPATHHELPMNRESVSHDLGMNMGKFAVDRSPATTGTSAFILIIGRRSFADRGLLKY